MQSDTDYLEITFNTIDEGITIYDDQLRLVMWNEQYSRMSITPADELYRGASLLDSYLSMARAGVFGDGDPQKLADTHIEALKNGPFIESEQLHGLSNRLIRINRFRLNNGGICATFRDITDERQTEALLRQSAKLKAIGNLTGGLAHDLNNFLAIIMGNLEIAQNDPDSASERIQRALSAADSGAQLIKSLLSFARQQPLAPVVTSVREPLNKLHTMLSKLIGNNVSVKIMCEADLWLTEIDVNQFESAVLNLLLNSRDAMPDGGELIITAANTVVDEKKGRLLDVKPGQYVYVSTSDTGVGMSASTVEQAFDPFFTTKPTKVGSGLGLSMAHGFARQSSGYINITSEVDSGTTVDLYLPRTQTTPIGRSSQQTELIKPSALSVLVVDDNEALQLSVATLIRSLGCAVVTASSGEEALEMSGLDSLDILLTDIVMPGMNGLTLAEKIVQMHPKLAVVYMSGHSDNALSNQGKLTAGAVILQKPFRLASLSAAFEKVMCRT